MAKTKPLPKRFRPFADQVANESEIRYGGQEAALESLLGQTTRGFERQSGAQDAAARSLLGSLASASSDLNRVYSDAGLTPSLLSQIGNSPTGQRLAGELARGQAGIQQQQLGAQAGRAYQTQHLGDEYREDTGKINDSLLALTKEKGLFAQSALSQLITGDRATRHDANEAARKQAAADAEAVLDRQASRDNSLISQGLLPDASGTLQPLPGGKADPNAPGNQPKPKSPWLDKGGQSSARSSISKAFAQAKRLMTEGRTRAEAAQILTEGRPGQQVVDRKGNKVNIPGVPSYEELYASVALDLAFDKHLSQRNVQELHGQGIKVKPLGYKTPGSLPKPKRSPHPGTTTAPGANGQQRPT